MESCDNDQVHLSSSSSSFSFSDKNHGRSKAQMCLKKILDFISFHSSTKPDESGVGNGIDLNLTLGGFSLEDLKYENKDSLSACSVCVVEDAISQRQCDESKVASNSMVTIEEHVEESSAIINLQDVEINHYQAPKQAEDEDEEHNNKVKNGKRKVAEGQSKGYLDLLVEAARLVSDGDNADASIQKKPSRPGQTQCNIHEAVPRELKVDANWFDCYGGIEVDMSPLVRSKRGRTQVLPSRYRDSVIEPLKKVTIATTTRKPSKLSAAKQRSRKAF